MSSREARTGRVMYETVAELDLYVIWKLGMKAKAFQAGGPGSWMNQTECAQVREDSSLSFHVALLLGYNRLLLQPIVSHIWLLLCNRTDQDMPPDHIFVRSPFSQYEEAKQLPSVCAPVTAVSFCRVYSVEDAMVRCLWAWLAVHQGHPASICLVSLHPHPTRLV